MFTSSSERAVALAGSAAVAASTGIRAVGFYIPAARMLSGLLFAVWARGGTGRHSGLKIRWLCAVGVRVPPRPITIVKVRCFAFGG